MTTKQPLGPNQEKWLKALESGRYKQVQYFLSVPNKGNCCLGVACRIFLGKPERTETYDGMKAYLWEGAHGYAPETVVNKLALFGIEGPSADNKKRSLSNLNDSYYSFKQIAAIIRENPGDYFIEPR